MATEKIVPSDPPGEDLQKLFDQLRHTCEALEQRDVSLERALELREEGAALERRIRAVLDDADRRVSEVLREDGSREPFVLAKK